MNTFRCNYCGYKTRKEKKPEKCNYCGREKSMVEVENAESLVKEL